MPKKQVEPPPPEKPVIGALPVPRFVITVVTLGLVGIIGYSATQQDYRSMIVEGLVLLAVLGADVGAILRSWRGQQ